MKLIQLNNIQFEDIDILKVNPESPRIFGRLYSSIENGFPSPAEDFEGEHLSLDERYLSKPESTYFAKAKGISNFPTIHEGDILIIRADLPVNDGDLAVVSFNNAKFTTKRLDTKNKRFIPDNTTFPEITVSDEDTVIVMGKVFAIIREDLTKKIF
ncbi:LexA family protein [Chryseobacterium sp. CT-SW4]|uniref:LexA family protein n=1 Tax=Chryseobacterium sp. SW-1 TaxID=3157343 RepID=UPI003B025F57